MSAPQPDPPAQAAGGAPAKARPPQRIRDAASLIILDRSTGTGEKTSVLMGRRSQRHVFMPGRFVFPGGRVDPTDARVPTAGDFRPETAARLALRMRSGYGVARIRAFGVTAVREAYEETGVMLARAGPAPNGADWRGFAERGLAVDLSPFAFVARAITPPGRSRRYDTRFFVAERAAIAAIDESVVGENAELEEIAWMPIEAARQRELPSITVAVLDELVARLAEDPNLVEDRPVPFYRMHHRRYVRELL